MNCAKGNLPMQHIASLRAWGKPSVSIQCTTTVNTHTFSSNCTVATVCQPPRAESPSCVTSRQLVSTNHSCIKGADETLPECLVASSSCNLSLVSTKREHIRHLLGSTLLTSESVDIEEDDLAAMVHDYMENGINDFHCHEKNDGVVASASTDLRHFDAIQGLSISTTPLEEELLSVINAIILSLKDKDLAYFACSPSCRGGCIRRVLVKHLQLLKYDAAVCSSKWPASGKMPGGEYEYVDVILEKGPKQSDRLIVAVDFQSQFEIARPTQCYLAALRTLPVLFVGPVEKLSQILQALAEAVKLSMRQNAMPVPPWRTLSYMTSKWLAPFERHVQNFCEKGSNSLGAAHARSTEQCIQQFHHLKMCLLSSGFVNKMHL